MKKFIRYWLPPIVWAALFFPLFDHYAGHGFLYRWTMEFLKSLGLENWYEIGGTTYIILRKSLHFIEYAVLALLLFRAFRGESKPRWRWAWAIPAGIIASAYGLLDEFLQTLVPDRNGSLIDWGIDTAGMLVMMAILYSRYKKDDQKTEPSRWAWLSRGLILKRPFDILLSSLGILLSSPLWLVFGFLIWYQDRGPVFYFQDRVGKNGRVFRAIKFRSMVADAERGRGAVQAIENDPRVTRLGRVLRATAMDELPQLFSIFKGDMSFVGPRALRPEEKEVHAGKTRRLDAIAGYRERQAVSPGLTGLAQVFLPTDAPRERKFRYDLFYIQDRSFWWDIELILLSFWVTLRGKWESRQRKV